MRFLEKVFTRTEIAYCNAKAQSLSALRSTVRREIAVSKAPPPAGQVTPLEHVEVTNDASGQPRISVYGRIKEHLGSSHILISLFMPMHMSGYGSHRGPR
jgi:phosphopantetheinyl transferase (holo-ACP synthase)